MKDPRISPSKQRCSTRRPFSPNRRTLWLHPTLSRDMKLAILREWEPDVRRLSASESEGFCGGEESMLGTRRRRHHSCSTARVSTRCSKSDSHPVTHTRSLSSDAKDTPRRFAIGLVDQDLRECCHARLSASAG